MTDILDLARKCGITAEPDQLRAFAEAVREEQRERDAAICRSELIGTGPHDHPSDRAYDMACTDCERSIRRAAIRSAQGEAR